MSTAVMLRNEIWRKGICRQMDALEEVVAAEDWMEASELGANLLQSLQQRPDSTTDIDPVILERARILVDSVHAEALRARQQTAQALRELGRGRKAVNAYS